MARCAGKAGTAVEVPGMAREMAVFSVATGTTELGTAAETTVLDMAAEATTLGTGAETAMLGVATTTFGTAADTTALGASKPANGMRSRVYAQMNMMARTATMLRPLTDW